LGDDDAAEAAAPSEANADQESCPVHDGLKKMAVQ
jgi:hypothetical protein